MQRVRREGERRGDRYFVVAVAPSEEGTRFAVTALSDMGTAVRRNRARRRGRAAFAPLVDRLARPADVIVSVRAAAVDAPFSELARSATDLLKQLGLVEVDR